MFCMGWTFKVFFIIKNMVRNFRRKILRNIWRKMRRKVRRIFRIVWLNCSMLGANLNFFLHYVFCFANLNTVKKMERFVKLVVQSVNINFYLFNGIGIGGLTPPTTVFDITSSHSNFNSNSVIIIICCFFLRVVFYG